MSVVVIGDWFVLKNFMLILNNICGWLGLDRVYLRNYRIVYKKMIEKFVCLKNILLICAIFNTDKKMEIGNLESTELSEKLHPKFKLLFDFVKNSDFDKLPAGRVDVDGDDVYVMNLSISGVAADSQPLEMHRKYIDVHILLGGKEIIGWKPLREIESYTQAYEESGDCALSDDTPRFFVELHPGEYCIVFPEDPHAPAIGDGPIRKLIGKVKI